MFQHIVYSLANRQGLFAYVRTCKTRLDTTTKFMVVVTSLFNFVISSFPDNMFYHVWSEHGCRFTMMFPTTLFKYVHSRLFKPWTVCSNMYEQACQQPCSSWPAQPCSSLSTTMFKLASSTMFKPVNNTVHAGQLNHVQACQQHYSSWPVATSTMFKPVNNHACSSWPAQPCSSLSTTLSKLASSTMFKPVNNTVQAGQLNHVQACQQAKSSCVFLRV